jgi:DNA-binding NarL/FixJ family response regulator
MARVWIDTPHALQREALAALVMTLGFPTATSSEMGDLAVVDLTTTLPPYQAAPDVPSIALALRPCPVEADRLKRLGYGAVLGPNASRAQLASALARLRPTAGAPDASVAPRIACMSPDPSADAGLTPREREVLDLVTLGLPNKRIASRLGIAERTVKHHVSAIMRKRGVRSRMRLIVTHHDDRADRVSGVLHATHATGSGEGRHRPSVR